MKLLSIDFDYFIDSTSEQRNNIFPNGADEVDTHTLKNMWKECYEENPEVSRIGVINEYIFMQSYLKRYSMRDIALANSHKDIGKIIDEIPLTEKIEVLNIDFHHDFYHYFTCGNTYNCGNWLRRLLEKRPHTKVEWICRSDSEIISLEGDLPFSHTTKLQSTIKMWGNFDKVFICKSPEWTPPHLDNYFNELVRNTQG